LLDISTYSCWKCSHVAKYSQFVSETSRIVRYGWPNAAKFKNKKHIHIWTFSIKHITSYAVLYFNVEIVYHNNFWKPGRLAWKSTVGKAIIVSIICITEFKSRTDSKFTSCCIILRNLVESSAGPSLTRKYKALQRVMATNEITCLCCHANQTILNLYNMFVQIKQKKQKFFTQSYL
jgi:hypothetical protein